MKSYCTYNNRYYNYQMTDNKLKSTINYIRDVLRTEGLTGTDSLDHCVIFMVFRMLDERTCKRLHINTKNKFDNFVQMIKDKAIPEDIYKEFVSRDTEDDSVVFNIVNKFHFTTLKFKLGKQNIDNLTNIIKKLAELDIDYLRKQHDIVGQIYEMHLKSGTKGSGMRDLGQFYTNRSVIRYMIKLCKPVIDGDKMDIIIDPTCGTAGFLTMTVEYLNAEYQNINWRKLSKFIVGYDIDEHIVNLAILNLFLETGFNMVDQIKQQDTLKNGMGNIHEKADVILANEPMGVKGIKYDNKHLCQHILDVNISGTKGEPLFLQLFAESLNDGGRCAVIVPDGVLFNESNQHKETRKYLIENFNLKKVVALNDDFFMNTGVKTSILFFVKDEETTKEVEFCEVKLKGESVEEKTIITVGYDKIKDTGYSLFVNKYNAVEMEKIDGIEYKKLGEVCEIKSGKPVNKDKRDGTKYPYFTSNGIEGYMDTYLFDGEFVILAQDGSIGACHKYEGKLYPSNHVWLITSNCVDKSYIYYWLTKMVDYKPFTTGSVIPKLSKTNLENINIAIPSIDIQKTIVEQLDILTNNIETCKKGIDELNKIMKAYMMCQTKNENEYKIGDIFKIENGTFSSGDMDNCGEYNFYSGKRNNPVGLYSKYNYEYDKYIVVIKGGGCPESRFREDNEIIGLGTSFLLTGKNAISDGLYVLTNKTSNNISYLYYIMMHNKNTFINNAQYTTRLGNLKKSAFENLKLNIPSIEKQKEIVAYCDDINNDIKNLEKRIENNKILMKQIMDVHLNVPAADIKVKTKKAKCK